LHNIRAFIKAEDAGLGTVVPAVKRGLREPGEFGLMQNEIV
jgi:hypothetical protein